MQHLQLGSIVTSPAGSGVVVDRDRTYGEALVRLYEGVTLDTEHGQWWPESELTVTGHDPDAMVWRGARRTRAGDPQPDAPAPKHTP